MSVVTSSLLGVNLSASDATALFALGTIAHTDDGGHFEYVEATATFITGEIVYINPANTAKTILTARAFYTSNAEGYDLAVCQGIINEGQFGWVAKKGRGLYVLCTGTVTELFGDWGMGENSGRLVTTVTAGGTLFGLQVTTGVSGSSNCAVCTLQWPRFQAHP
jgi:hypothetical protein